MSTAAVNIIGKNTFSNYMYTDNKQISKYVQYFTQRQMLCNKVKGMEKRVGIPWFRGVASASTFLNLRTAYQRVSQYFRKEKMSKKAMFLTL